MKLLVMKIKKLMGGRGLTQTQLAQLTGISRQQVSTILSKGSCTVISAVRIADALNVDIEEIVKEE